MNKGDIVLVKFPFTDLSGNKFRPAVILIKSEVDVTVCFLTSQIKWQSEFDITIQPSSLNGLKKMSLIRLNKLATINKDLVIGRIGSLNKHQVNQLDSNLINIFQIVVKKS